MKLSKLNISLVVAVLTMPLFIYAIVNVLPTYDDWSTLSSPNFNPEWQQFFFRWGVVWRPLDALMGYIVALDYRLFPTLNHICIFTGHALNTFMVYRICRKFNFQELTANIATIYFYLSPAMLGTVLSVDGLNQTYAHLFGLLSLWVLLTVKGTPRYPLFLLMVMAAALAKENGLAWAVAAPVVVRAFKSSSLWQFLKDVATGILTAALYAAIRLSIPYHEIINNEYFSATILYRLSRTLMLVAYTWIPIDYVSLFHEPSRSYLMLAATTLLALPMLWLLFVRRLPRWFTRRVMMLLGAYIVVMSPHLVTAISTMHTYAGLSVASLALASVIDLYPNPHRLKRAFFLFLLAFIITDAHHTVKAIETSRTGKRMALQVISQARKPINKSFTINIEGNQRKFSLFCVTPIDAFSNGEAVEYETGYRWPLHREGINISEQDVHKVDSITNNALKAGFEGVFVVRGDSVAVRE